VIVESRRGRIELPAWIERRGSPPPGSLFVPFFDETLLINEGHPRGLRPLLQAARLQEVRRSHSAAVRPRGAGVKQRDTLEERMRGSGALLVALALLVAGSLLGLLLGVSDEHATAGKRREAREIASGGGDPDGLESARPARRYGDMDAMATGPNRAWPGAVSDQIAPPSSPPTYASQAELRALKGASLRKRAERRAYNGAPPTIPHPISDRDAASCVACHGDGLAMGTFAAPKMSHPFMVNCAQCHAPVSNSGPARDRGGIDDSANLFEGAAAPLEGSRAWPGAPPIIPHSLAMRGDCLSCHGPAGAPGIRTSHPERTNCQQCHAPPGALPDGSSASSRDGASDSPLCGTSFKRARRDGSRP
jgi:cytochrome c-type protein NapB